MKNCGICVLLVALGALVLVPHGPAVSQEVIDRRVLLVDGRPLVNIERLRDSQGNRVYALGEGPAANDPVAQGAINSEAINNAFLAMRSAGTGNATQFDGLYVPAKRYPIGPKLFAPRGYGASGLFGSGGIYPGGTVFGSEGYNAVTTLVKVSHFDEPILQIPGAGFRLDGISFWGWHQEFANSSIPGRKIADASNTTPIVIETTGHGLADGDYVRVIGVRGNTAANSNRKAYVDAEGDGRWRVKVVDDDHFELWGRMDYDRDIHEYEAPTNPSSGNGDYIPSGDPDQNSSGGFWITPGSARQKFYEEQEGRGRYAEVGVEIVRGNDWPNKDEPDFGAGGNSSGKNTQIGHIGVHGCEYGIRLLGTNTGDENTLQTLATSCYGAAVRWEHGSNTTFVANHVHWSGQAHLRNTPEDTSIGAVDNVFSMKDFNSFWPGLLTQGGGGGNVGGLTCFAASWARGTLLRTNSPNDQNGKFIITRARTDQEHWSNRFVVMDGASGVAGEGGRKVGHYRIGVQYGDYADRLTEQTVVFRTGPTISGATNFGIRQPDIQIDCHPWRRDQALGFPVRPVANLPIPLYYTTQAFPSTKLWIDASQIDAGDLSDSPATGLTDKRNDLRQISAVADLSDAENDLIAAESSEPGWIDETFNTRPTFLIDTIDGHANSPFRGFKWSSASTDFVAVGDIEIMFPIVFRLDDSTNERQIIAYDDFNGDRGWGLRVQRRDENGAKPIRRRWYHFLVAGGPAESCWSQVLENDTPYLVHLRRDSTTGVVELLVNNGLSHVFADTSYYPEDFDFTTNNVPPPFKTEVAWDGNPGTTTHDLDGPQAALSTGTLAGGGSQALTFGTLKDGAGWRNPLRAMVPEIFIDTALLTEGELRERKRYLRAKYGVWEGTQLDQPAQ